jgi:hypothetical protein
MLYFATVSAPDKGARVGRCSGAETQTGWATPTVRQSKAVFHFPITPEMFPPESK